MKILIAYDGSQGADDALDDLPCAGLPPLAEALIVSVAEVFAPPPGSAEAAGPVPVPPAVRQGLGRSDSGHCGSANAGAAGTHPCAGAFPRLAGTSRSVCRFARLGVIKQADTWHPDLIVVVLTVVRPLADWCWVVSHKPL